MDPGMLQFVGIVGVFLWPWLGLVGEVCAGDPDIAIPNIKTGLVIGGVHALIALAGFAWRFAS